MTKDHNTIGIPPLTRLLKVVRVSGGWQLWTGMRSRGLGTYIQLNNDGSSFHVTLRANEGDDSFPVRPPDRYAVEE